MERLAIETIPPGPHLHTFSSLRKDIHACPGQISTSSDRDHQTRRTAPSQSSRCSTMDSRNASPCADSSNMSTAAHNVSAATLSKRGIVRAGSKWLVLGKTAIGPNLLSQNTLKESLNNEPGPGPYPGGRLPPTPPADSSRTFPRHDEHTSLSRGSPNSLSSQQERSHTSEGTAQNTDRSASRPNTIILPVGNNMAQQLSAPSTSLNRAIDALGEFVAYEDR